MDIRDKRKIVKKFRGFGNGKQAARQLRLDSSY